VTEAREQEPRTVFRSGWQVYRERLPELVDQRHHGRALRVGIVVAVVAFAGLLALGWFVERLDGSVPGPAGIIVALLVSGGIGCVGAALVPIGPRGWALAPVSGIGWRTQDAIARYHRRNPPPVAPEHRDAVLQGMPATRDLLVRTIYRSLFVVGGWTGIVLGTLVYDLTARVDSDTVILFPGVWLFSILFTTGTGIVGIRTLGRQEQLRVEAEALPPVPSAPRRGRPDSPSGSKLALPGE
jgi:hypothetical protein